MCANDASNVPLSGASASGGPRKLRFQSLRHALQLIGGLSWFAVWAIVFAGFTGAPFWMLYPGLLTVLVLCGALVIWWFGGSFGKAQKRRSQFRLVTLFVLTFLIAVFLGGIRWLMVSTASHIEDVGAQLTPYENLLIFICVMIGFVLFAVLSLPILVGLMESLAAIASRFMQPRTASPSLDTVDP